MKINNQIDVNDVNYENNEYNKSSLSYNNTMNVFKSMFLWYNVLQILCILLCFLGCIKIDNLNQIQNTEINQNDYRINSKKFITIQINNLKINKITTLIDAFNKINLVSSLILIIS